MASQSTAMTEPLVWLITGTSHHRSGLGHDLALAALARGELVVATTRTRSLSSLEDLRSKGAHILELDVTWPLDKLKDVAMEAVGIYGRIDVLVNNAGYAELGALEEHTHEETVQQFKVNVFGALNVSRAFLPHMRTQRSGVVMFMGSITSWVQSPFSGLYGATKCALKGVAETFAVELAPLGIHSLYIDAGYFRTALLDPNNRAPYRPRIGDYELRLQEANDRMIATHGKQAGDPRRAGEVLVHLVKQEGLVQGRDLPVDIALGSDSHDIIKLACESTLRTLRVWDDVIVSTDYSVI